MCLLVVLLSGQASVEIVPYVSMDVCIADVRRLVLERRSRENVDSAFAICRPMLDVAI